MTLVVSGGEDKDRLDKLATYLAHGVPAGQAGAAVGYSAARVSQLLAQEDFASEVKSKVEELSARFVDTNNMYGRIEEKALKNLMEVITYDKDPDLNIRAAMLANRAVRRGNGTNGVPILSAPGEGERIARISLSFGMQRRIENGDTELGRGKVVDGEGKTVSMATPVMVESLLGQLQVDIRGQKDMKNAGNTESMQGFNLIEMLVPIDG